MLCEIESRDNIFPSELELLEATINTSNCPAKLGWCHSRQKLPGLALNRVVAGRLPVKNQVPFLRASGSVTCIVHMNEDMGCTILNGMSLLLVILSRWLRFLV